MENSKKIGLLITTYNRPEYLRQCLDSLRRADLSKVRCILFVDDHSTDHATLKLISEFELPGIITICQIKEKNESIKSSLLFGFNWFFENGYDLVMNLDGDAIVNNLFVDRILAVNAKYPDCICTGFNCNTKNKDGSVRHEEAFREEGVIFRRSVGGINMCFSRGPYMKYVKPALMETIANGGNWDHLTCINSMDKDSLPITVVCPSVIDHIGFNSSMGHQSTGEAPDTAEDFMPLSLPNVTLIGVDDNIELLCKAMKKSIEHIDFGAVKILSCTTFHRIAQLMLDKIKLTQIEKLGSKEAYSRFIFKNLVDFIETDYFIVCQADGFILNYKAWTNEFFNYDYIGAIWHFRKENRVGNGGFSFRSKKLHLAINGDPEMILKNDKHITNFAEDHNIGNIYRAKLEKEHEIKFATEELCERFSIESWLQAAPANKYQGSFGFHGFGVDFNGSDLSYKPYLLPNQKIKYD